MKHMIVEDLLCAKHSTHMTSLTSYCSPRGGIITANLQMRKWRLRAGVSMRETVFIPRKAQWIDD